MLNNLKRKRLLQNEMSSSTQVFDPQGDVQLRLLNNADGELYFSSAPQDLYAQVSSHVLKLSSPVFRAMLQTNFQEGDELQSQGSVTLDLRDDDKRSMIVLMSIVHGRGSKVPLMLSKSSLFRIAILVDKYELHESVSFHAHYWIQGLAPIRSQDDCDQVTRRLCIAWIFKDDAGFESATRAIVTTWNTPFEAPDLPIPEHLVGMLLLPRVYLAPERYKLILATIRFDQ